jgi:putative sporulation protein YyaC
LNEDILNKLISCVSKVHKSYDKIIYLCIGTDRSTGDSFGPLVGTMLKDRIVNNNVKVIGTIHNPVHALNLCNTIEQIEIENTLIIAIDACLGKTENIGKIIICDKSILPGSALGKDLPSVGDISIEGIVNASGSLEFMVLQNTRLSTVYDLAEKTAWALSELANNEFLIRSERSNKIEYRKTANN